MKKKFEKEIKTITIDKLGSEGEGYSIQDDLAVFYTLPGETVSVEVGYQKRTFLKEILIPSKNRIEPYCPFFGHCGGCSLQHVSRETYHQFKKENLQKLLQNADITTHLHDLISVEKGQRRRVSFSYKNLNGVIRFGFLKRQSKFLTDIDSCPLLTARLNSLIQPTKELLEKITPEKSTGFVMVTETQYGIDFSFSPHHKPKFTPEQIQLFAEFSRENGVSRITRAGKELLIENDVPSVEFDGQKVDFPAGAFLQPSIQGETLLKESMLRFIEKYAKKPKLIFDLFCGLGTFTLPLSKIAKTIGYDITGESIQNLAKVLPLPSKVEARNLFTNPLDEHELKSADVVVLDPPRAGARDQMEHLKRAKTPLIVYISCHAGTFLRDAKDLIEAGYELKELQPVDQFPDTAHIELVSAFVFIKGN
ncbi:MAG: class I SAM-dependent RNA methyltransferase [Alphaproteobacteria bacterium]|nr:class I SAM-dependent RNA methyltransferase [Alphaproteobacteria bacterium]